MPATYENSIVCPLQLLSLPEGQPLQIQIVVHESLPEFQRMTRSFEASGILTSPPYASSTESVPEV